MILGEMDVERTMQFILDQQARTESLRQRNEENWQRNEEKWQRNEELRQRNEERWQRNEENWRRNWQRAEGRTEILERRQEKFDKSLVGIRKLILLGMKTLSNVTASQKAAVAELREIREDIRGITAAQKRTDQKFDRLVELLSRRSPNGHR
jgi:hypothetical protein